MNRFLYPKELHADREIELSPEESHHLVKVLRMEAGGRVQLMNGAGQLADATIVNPSNKCATLKIESVKKQDKRPVIHLVFGVPKTQALDFIIHRSTELGVASFQPLMTQHSLLVTAITVICIPEHLSLLYALSQCKRDIGFSGRP